MMKNYDESVKINHNPNWYYISGTFYRIVIIGGLGSGKTNVLVDLIKHQRPDIKKNTVGRQRSIPLKVLNPYQLKRKSRD